MFLLDFTLLFQCALLCTAVAANGVAMVPTYSSTHITLTCTAYDTQAHNFMIHLSCPFIKDGFCFSNCRANCQVANNGCVRNPVTNAISSCEYINSSQNQVSTVYRINTALISQTGDWVCSFKNFRSNAISLMKYEAPVTTTQSTKTFTEDIPIQTETVTDKYFIEEIKTFVPNRKPNFTRRYPQSTIGTQEIASFNIIKHLTQPELVLGLVIMLGFSLLLNLSFLIRCVLLKSVIDNYHRGVPNSSCILGCLCIDQYARQKNYSRSLNLYNQVGSDFYRCQPMPLDNAAIYDDLSAASNGSARIKLRSNHSSEMDEETRLTSFISNGGCHMNSVGTGSVSTSLPRRYTSSTHAAYFHPGIGNYVIVSGPIATQDQYTIGAAPPGYTLQMVSPIPSAPGSIVGGPGANLSVQSTHSDDLFDSDNSQTTNQSGKLNNHLGDSMDSNKIIDLSQAIRVPVNGFNPNRSSIIHNNYNLNRPNGSVPLHPWPGDKVPQPASSSVTSLPQYSVSESGAFIQDVHRASDLAPQNSINLSSAEAKS